MKKLIAASSILAILATGMCADAFGFKKKQKEEMSKKPVQVEVLAVEHECPQPQFEGILSQASYKISAINPSGGGVTASYFPGGRGANQLVIYNDKSGIRTGTNEFGAEAIVLDSTVIQISGADSIIPKNGYVISGHGDAKTWMNQNLTVGTKISIDYPCSTVTAYLTNDSFIFATKEKIKEIDRMMRYYKDSDIYYDDSMAHKYVTQAVDNLKRANRHPNDTQKYSAMAINSANKALQFALPYYKNEFKGVWLRPTELTEEAIGQTLDKVKQDGIETIFLETYYQGKTIFPSETLTKYKVQAQRSEYKDCNFDPLKVWVDEAHKRGLKVHIWFETFYAGNENPMDNPTNVISVYPQWANKTKAKYNSSLPVASLSEHNGYFLDPANPEVQQYLQCLLEEIITKYKPDGINLDYIRYPQSISAKFAGYDLSNWGYSEYARNEFKAASGVDPVNIKYTDPLWNSWAQYRQNKITSFVFKTKQMTSKYGIPVTTVIFPDRMKSLEVKMQDWKTWTDNNYVDGFTPLILTCDKDTAVYMINDIKSNSKPNTKIYPGLFIAFMNGNPDDLLRQLHESRRLKTGGIIFFDYAHMENKYTDVLMTNAFSPSTATSTTLSKKGAVAGKKVKKKKKFFRFGKKKSEEA